MADDKNFPTTHQNINPELRKTKEFFSEKRRIENYQIIKELGRGGMGVVYLAYDEVVQREVVLKFILRDIKKNTKRFLREAEAASCLDHPNIIKLFKVFFYQNNPCMVMQYVKGKTLAEHTSKNLLSLEEKLQIIRKMAESLDYAHQKKVIHRDIKPANILIDEAGEPFLMDFGLAKIIDVDKKLTKTGEIMGSPGYMSPEQAQGQRHLTPSTDVYSLGVVMYELLTDHKMFNNENVMSFLYDVMYTQPSLPTSLNADIPKDIEKICLKAIEKNPQIRYKTCKQLAQDIRLFLAGKNNSITLMYQLKKYWYQQKAVIISAFIVLLVAAIAIPSWRVNEPIKDESYYDNLDSQSLIGEVLLERAAFYKSQGGYDKALKDYNKALEITPENPTLYKLKGEIYSAMRLYPQALENYQQALKFQPNHVELQSKCGDIYRVVGNFSQAKENYQKALSLDPSYIPSLLGLALINQHIPPVDREQANTLYQKILQIDKKHFETHRQLAELCLGTKKLNSAQKHLDYCFKQHSQHPEILWLQGNVYFYQQNYTEAEKWYIKAIQIMPENSYYHAFLGYLRYNFLRKISEAELDLKAALKINPQEPFAVLHQADFYKQQGKYKEALVFYNRYIEIFQDGSPQKADGHFRRGTFQHSEKKYQEAIADYTKAIEIDPHRDHYKQRAVAFMECKNFENAEKDLTQALSLLENSEDVENSIAIKIEYLKIRSRIYLNLKEYEKAKQDIQQAIQIQPKNPHLYFHRSEIYIAMADNEKENKPQLSKALYEQSAKDLQYFIREIPDNLTGYQRLASLYRSRNILSKALETLEQAQQRGFEVSLDIAYVLRDDKQYKRLHELLQIEQQKHPENPQFYLLEGKAFKDQKLFELAEQSYLKAVATSDGIFGNIELADLCIFAKQDNQKAIEYATAVLQRDPQNSEALELRSLAFQRNKQFQEALNDCEELIKERTQKHKGHLKKVEIYMEMNNLADAEKEYDALIEMYPNSPDYYWKRAHLYKKRGKTQEALDDLKKASQLGQHAIRVFMESSEENK